VDIFEKRKMKKGKRREERTRNERREGIISYHNNIHAGKNLRTNDSFVNREENGKQSTNRSPHCQSNHDRKKKR
jgi:hypothetical protein